MIGARLAAAALLLGVWPSSAAAQHEGHEHHAPKPAAATPAPAAPPATPPPGLPVITDADRAAAFPDVGGHAAHDDEAIHAYVLFDQLEWQSAPGRDGIGWDAKSWIGRDRDRLWIRSEGVTNRGRLETGDVHALFGRAISPWWELVAGVRQDFGAGPARTWAEFGVQGLAPYWIDVEASGYVGGDWRTALRLEAKHELLVTNRLVLQSSVETEFFGKDDPAREIGAGLSSMDGGFRVRYELRRELAPYVGVVWHRTFFGTADQARRQGHPAGDTRLVVGLRVWQ